MEKVSIIIPSYNSENCIEKCLKHLKKQTYSNIEIIVVNDGSTDSTEQIVKRIQKTDSKIKYYSKVNGGPGSARLYGVAKATGAYILFVDSDDEIDKDMTEILLLALKKNKCDIVRCGIRTIQNGIKKEMYHFQNEVLSKEEFEPTIYDYLYDTIQLNSPCAQLIKKELFEGINRKDLTLLYGEDLLMNLELMKKAEKIVLLDKVKYNYIINNKGITLTKDINKVKKKLEDSIKVYYKLFDSVNYFNIKNKEKYYQLATTKFYFYIVNRINELASTLNIKEITNLLKPLLKTDEVNQIYQYQKTKRIGNIIEKIQIYFIKKKNIKIVALIAKYIMRPLKQVVNKK